MEQFIVCETDKGHIAVRPLSWVGVWNERGQIEETLNHTALFNDKEEAEKFAEWKNAEEQGLLLKLPCKVGDTIYYTHPEHMDGKIEEYMVTGFCFDKQECQIRTYNPKGVIIYFYREFIGKTVFLTQAEAEEALRKMNGTEE